MIVIPMLGLSSRFFNAGYSLPKYQLPLGGETVFAHCVGSFSALFEQEHFVFVVRNQHNAAAFTANAAAQLGIRDFRVRQIEGNTRGQAHSVMLGTHDYAEDCPLIIFNIDTIRHGFQMPAEDTFADGYLEVFEGEGEAWSFIQPGPNHQVLRTTEKVRISNLCSNGLYGFKRLGDFRQAFNACASAADGGNGELYVAPLYNHLIAQGRTVKYAVLPAAVTAHCGTPADYERLNRNLVHQRN